jgi:hypothetical protein
MDNPEDHPEFKNLTFTLYEYLSEEQKGELITRATHRNECGMVEKINTDIAGFDAIYGESKGTASFAIIHSGKDGKGVIGFVAVSYYPYINGIIYVCINWVCSFTKHLYKITNEKYVTHTQFPFENKKHIVEYFANQPQSFFLFPYILKQIIKIFTVTGAPVIIFLEATESAENTYIKNHGTQLNPILDLDDPKLDPQKPSHILPKESVIAHELREFIIAKYNKIGIDNRQRIIYWAVKSNYPPLPEFPFFFFRPPYSPLSGGRRKSKLKPKNTRKKHFRNKKIRKVRTLKHTVY